MRLKRILTALAGILPAFLLTACGTSSAAANPLDGTYYCERIMVYDSDGNMRQFLNSEDAGSENTYLTIKDGKSVEYCYYYHGEADETKNGSMRDQQEKDGTVSADVLFEGDADSYNLTYETDEATGKPTRLVLVHHFGEKENYLGLIFKTEKHETRGEPYQDIEDADGKAEEFASSETYQRIEDALNSTYSGMPHELTIDTEKKQLVLSVEIADLASALGKSEKLDSTWAELCEGFDKTSDSIQVVINTGGYKGISFVMDVKDGDTQLYRSENGERTYTLTSSESSATAPVNTASPEPASTKPSSGTTGKDSFESTDTYRKISKIIKDAFPDRSPKITYSEKDKMLNIVLTGGKNWQTAVLNDSASYSAWVDFTNSLLDVSASGYDVLCDEGYPDIACTIMVVSYEDNSKAMFACMNGVPYYDFTED